MTERHGPPPTMISIERRDPSLAWPLDELAGGSYLDVRPVDTARLPAADAV